MMLWAATLLAAATIAPGPRTEAVPEAGYAAIFHVAPSGSDQKGDGSAKQPWRTIRRALEEARETSGKGRCAIKVAAGTYREGALALPAHVDLYGGFDPADWRRDIQAHGSVLDGEGRGRVAVVRGETTLDGFVLTGGSVRGPGGALLCEGCAARIRNNVFVGNETLAPQPWNPKELHETAHDGGAMACLAGAAARIEHNLFVRNRTQIGRGGAVAFSRSGGVVRGNVFLENRTGVNDPMRSSDGGAIAVWDWSDPAIEENLILQNQAGARNDGGGIFAALWSAPLIRKNLIAGNYADDDGGGLFVGGQKHHYSTPPDPVPPAEKYLVRILGNYIAGNANVAASSGALRVTMESRVLFANNVVTGNLGLARFQRSEVTVVNNTFLDPVSYDEVSDKFRQPLFANNIFHAAFTAPPGVAVRYSALPAQYPGEGNLDVRCGFEEAPWLTVATLTTYRPERFWTEFLIMPSSAPGDLTGRPIRIAAQWSAVAWHSGNRLAVWGDFREDRVLEVFPWFRLRPDSPCIDAGSNRDSPDEDREGRKRPMDGGRGMRVDLGAYEFDPRERR
jgi:hypothetical protein